MTFYSDVERYPLYGIVNGVGLERLFGMEGAGRIVGSGRLTKHDHHGQYVAQ